MKKFFILLIFIAGAFSVSSQDITEQANEAYTKSEFSRALDLYNQILEENGMSAAVYYNIGNCYYRMNKVAPAIINYERALLLSPGNKDIRFNLEIARLKTIDKIEPSDDFFLTEWYLSVKNLLGANQWSYFAIGSFLLFIACLVLFFFSRVIVLKKTGFYFGLVFLVFTLISNTFAYSQKEKLANRNTAIIFSPTVTIKSSPDNSGTDLFILHEGTKVEVKSRLNEWKEIETADGHVGWIKETDMEII
jgi:tetratricopeptide (TPR) repeat protein